jgi:alpha-glucosidase
MQDLDWWKRAVIYEVYPRSFQDSNGDGIGDLHGIFARLDYLVELRVDALWIAPIYPSPMADFGYDIADYCGIDPIFGNMSDFDLLLEQVHRHGLRLILDFVPNHTSEQHPWFLESRSSRGNAKRDWYIWRDQPNNWTSNFGGSAWEFDELTGQYYYHSFLKQQPDLNWRNPAVKAAMFDVLRFWLQKRCGWISRRRNVADHQGRSISRQSHQPGLSRRTFVKLPFPPHLQHEPARSARHRRRDAQPHRRIFQSRADW